VILLVPSAGDTGMALESVLETCKAFLQRCCDSDLCKILEAAKSLGTSNTERCAIVPVTPRSQRHAGGHHCQPKAAAGEALCYVQGLARQY